MLARGLRFGRPLRTIVTTGGQSWTVGRLFYDDSVSGRRLVQESFPGSTAKGSESGAGDVQRSTTVFDALARVRFTQSELGSNYSGASIVSDFAARDAMGRVVFVASPFEVGGAFAPDNVARHGTTYVYDVRGRPVRTVEATGQNAAATDTNLAAKVYVASTQYAYSGGELTVRTQGPDERDPTSPRYGWSNESTRTAAGVELRKVRKDASGTVKDKVEFVWDRLGRVVETRRFQTPTSSVASSVWTDSYDSIGNLLRATEPGTARHSTYDEFGNQLETAWMDGTTRRVSRTSYDGFSRVLQRELISTVAGGSPVTESLDLFHYDVASGDPAQPAVAAARLRGRLSWVEHPGVGNVYYGYDALGRGDAEVFQYQNVMGVVSQSSESTVGGRLARLRLTTEATDDSITYSYDSAGRTTGIDDDNGRLFNASSITPLGQYLAVEFGNGVAEKYKYSQTGRRELRTWAAATNSGEYTYTNETRDAEGRVVAELHNTPATMTYLTAAYDGVGRLTSRIQATSMVPQVDTFTYDGLGNITSRTTPVGATFQYTPSTTDPDRLCRYAAPGSGTACQFTYDGAGNVTQDSATGSMRTIAYDAGQRITSIARGSTSVALTYGPVGRMKTEVSGPSARTVWTFGGMIERRQRPDGVIQIERSIPGPLGTFVSLRSELDSRGSVVNREQIYRHGDGRANRFFTRADGKVVQDATYSVFGNVVAGSDDGSFTGSDDLWNGGDELPEVGVTLLGPRAYDPLLGRFLQRDPIAVLRRSSTANPYSFAFSDPVNHSDPTGLTPPECTGSECASTMEVGIAGLGLSLGSSQSRRQRPAPRGRGHGTDRIKVNLKALEAEPQFFGGGRQSWMYEFGSGIGDSVGGFLYTGLLSGAPTTAMEMYNFSQDPSGYVVNGAKSLANGATHTLAMAAAGPTVIAERIRNSDEPLREAGRVGGDAAVAFLTHRIGAKLDSLAAASSSPRSLKPEAKYLRGGKHGFKWTEGPALAKDTNINQGQWGNIDDLNYAGDMAATLPAGQGGFFRLPLGPLRPGAAPSIVHMPDGSILPAGGIWVRNNGTGTFHGYPTL